MWDTTVTCEGGCGQRAAVPEPGATPAGWLVLVSVEKKLDPGSKQIVPQRVARPFCGWQCLGRYALQRAPAIVEAG